MLKDLTSILLALGVAVGCTAQAQRREKIARARSEALERDLKASEEARKQAESKSGALQTSLDEVSKWSAGAQDQLRALEANLKAREEEIARLTSDESSASLSPDELKAKLTAAVRARDDAKRDLAALREREKNTQRSLEQQKNLVLQVFLENAFPDTLFALGASGLGKIFKLEGRDCALVFDMAREVEMLHGDALSQIPRLENVDIMPMRVAYNKILVCKNGGTLQVGRETGHLYRAQSNNNPDERTLVSGRERSMCDGRSEPLVQASVFGAARYQVVGAYRDQVHGIETIDLLSSGDDSIRLNSGSGEISSASCADAQELVGDDSAVVLACKIVRGQRVAGLAQVDGCFTEQKKDDGTSLMFNP